jgi:uncharacterized sporulation protein YeaH/YhbH (DUF444 family)
VPTEALSEEQREIRRRTIVDTALAMLDEMPVAEVSLNELSRRVGLAKSNVLVIWLFDASGSLNERREAIADRFFGWLPASILVTVNLTFLLMVLAFFL